MSFKSSKFHALRPKFAKWETKSEVASVYTLAFPLPVNKWSPNTYFSIMFKFGIKIFFSFEDKSKKIKSCYKFALNFCYKFESCDPDCQTTFRYECDNIRKTPF